MSDALELVLDVGLDARGTGATNLEIRRADGTRERLQVLSPGQSPSPSEISRALDRLSKGERDGVMFVVARPGRALMAAASEDPRVHYAATSTNTVRFGGELRYGPSHETSPLVATTTRTSWTRWAVLRLLTTTARALTQSDIAREVGVSHVAVGKQMPALDPLVERVDRGWRVLDPPAAWEAFLTGYPGPRGLSTFWASTGDLPDRLSRLSATGPLAFSGSVAADHYAPWKRPARIIGYATTQPPLEDTGFAQVRADESDIEIRMPQDPTVLAMARGSGDRLWVDPLLCAWDLAREPGGDSASAVEELRRRVLRNRDRA